MMSGRADSRAVMFSRRPIGSTLSNSLMVWSVPRKVLCLSNTDTSKARSRLNHTILGASPKSRPFYL